MTFPGSGKFAGELVEIRGFEISYAQRDRDRDQVGFLVREALENFTRTEGAEPGDVSFELEELSTNGAPIVVVSLTNPNVEPYIRRIFRDYLPIAVSYTFVYPEPTVDGERELARLGDAIDGIK